MSAMLREAPPAPEPVTVPLIEPIIRHPENMLHDHLARMLRRHPELVGTRVARIAETLRDGLVWGI